MTEDGAIYFSNAGDMIRYIRREKKITIVELAAKMGVSQAYIVRIERGEIKPTVEQVETLHAFIEGKL